MMRSAAAPFFCMALVALCARPAHAQDGGRSLADGVFSKAQAERGRELFTETCGVCHTRGQFTDGTFRRNWQGRTLFDVFEQIRSTMPKDSPGRLTGQEYLDVILYLFSEQGYPAGEEEINATAAGLRQIRITPPPPGSRQK